MGNNAVMVLRPSLDWFNALIRMWKKGNHRLFYAENEHGDQDIIIELCIVQGQCGPVSDLDACIYNHGSWLPDDLGRICDVEKVVARHNFRPSREEDLALALESAFRRGTCRPQFGLEKKARCWEDAFDRDLCCAPWSQHEPWGNAGCWGNGLSYERCCIGIDESQRLRRDLVRLVDRSSDAAG